LYAFEIECLVVFLANPKCYRHHHTTNIVDSGVCCQAVFIGRWVTSGHSLKSNSQHMAADSRMKMQPPAASPVLPKKRKCPARSSVSHFARRVADGSGCGIECPP